MAAEEELLSFAPAIRKGIIPKWSRWAEMITSVSYTHLDQTVLAIQKELEEATALELPMMEQNLPIIGTITTLGTLMGLILSLIHI